MKILFITNKFPPLVDGVGDYTYNIAKQFVEHNHDVYIICKSNPKINTQIYGMKIYPIIKEWDFKSYKPILKLINEKDIDIVSLQYVPHGYQPKGLPFPLIKLTKEIKRNKTKLFTFCHEVCVEKGNIKRTILSLVMRHISKRIVENSDYVATSIEYYKNIIIKLVHHNIDIPLIPIASNIPETKLSKKEIVEFKKKLAPNNEIIISFFGIRDISTSIDVISELKKEGQNLKILLIGKTSNILPKNLPEDTLKTGIIDIEEIDKYLKVSDIFILPENKEFGCSLKSGSLAAALRNNLPIITTKGKLTSSFLINQNNILFCDFNSKENLKKNIFYIIKHYKEIVNNCSQINWDKTYEAYINIIK